MTTLLIIPSRRHKCARSHFLQNSSKNFGGAIKAANSSSMLWQAPGDDEGYVCVVPPSRVTLGDIGVGFVNVLAAQHYKNNINAFSCSLLIAPIGTDLSALLEVDETLKTMVEKDQQLSKYGYKSILNAPAKMPLSVNVSLTEGRTCVQRLHCVGKEDSYAASKGYFDDIQKGVGICLQIVIHKLRKTPNGPLQPRLYAEAVCVDLEDSVRTKFATRHGGAPVNSFIELGSL